MTVTELLYDGQLDVDAIEARWGNPAANIVGTLYTSDQCAEQSTIDVPDLIAEVRRAREALLAAQAIQGDSGELAALKAENEALRQANSDARELIASLKAELAKDEPETPA